MDDPFARVPGAIVDEHGPLHFGSPHREQRELAAGRAVALLGDRSVLSVTGPDRLTWLDSITSQAVSALAPGESTELLVLDPQDADGTHRVVGGTASALAPLSAVAVWTDPWPGVATGGWGYAPADPHPGAARDWAEAIVDLDQYAALAAPDSGDGTLAGRWAADALRIAAWRPRASAEADGRTLPHEVDWLRTAVHLEKGCYRGQETVAKVHNLGHPPRRLIALQLDGSDAILPDPGADVLEDGVPVGAITSVARHYEEGPIALALVKRTLAEDAVLTVRTDDGEVAASAETIVPPDAGRTAAVPRLPRLSRRR